MRFAFGLVCTLCVLLSNGVAQSQSGTPLNIDPDNGKMGSYRALAHLAFRAYEQKDDKTAAVLARVLERVWDQGEKDLLKTAPDTWKNIDKSMDGFVKPLTKGAGGGRADEVKEQAAFQAYLDSLRGAD